MEADKKINSVLVSDDIDQICQKLLQQNGIKVCVDTKLTAAELRDKIKDFDALIVRSSTKVTKEVIYAGGQKLKVIGRAGTGVDNIDMDAATNAGILVINTPLGNSRSVAEITCAMILNLCRKIPQACASVKQEKWDRKNFMGIEVCDRTLAIIGLGRIGREVASRMQVFGMKTIGYDPVVNAEESRKFGVEWVPLENLWPVADFITVHVPLIPETKNLINADTLAKCKKGVYVINTARGGIVDEASLLEALESGQCAGAAIDTLLKEPPNDFSLIKHPNLICTPHIGASTVEAQQRVAEEIALHFVTYNKGEKVVGAVNEKAMLACQQKIPTT